MARDDPHFRLRLPEALRDKIVLSADLSRRSINGEIVARLEASFASTVAEGDPDEAYLRRLMRETLDASLDELLGDAKRLRKLGLRRDDG